MNDSSATSKPLSAERIEQLRAEWGECWTPTDEEFHALLDMALASIPSERGAYRGIAIPDGLAPATADLVIAFAQALAEKLRAAEVKYGYTDKWSIPDWEEECREKLIWHLTKGDPRDVANYCMFLWYHGWSTARPNIERSIERHTTARNDGS